MNWGILTSGLSLTVSTSFLHCSCSSLVVLETENNYYVKKNYFMKWSSNYFFVYNTTVSEEKKI